MAIIRWLGAFRQGARTLSESLTWELTQEERHTLAAERVRRGEKSSVPAGVGLLVANSAVVKKFRGDVWSEYRGRRLVKTRSENVSTWHNECWVRPVYRAIVIKSGTSRRAVEVAENIAAKHGLPVLILDGAGTLHNKGGKN